MLRDVGCCWERVKQAIRKDVHVSSLELVCTHARLLIKPWLTNQQAPCPILRRGFIAFADPICPGVGPILSHVITMNFSKTKQLVQSQYLLGSATLTQLRFDLRLGEACDCSVEVVLVNDKIGQEKEETKNKANTSNFAKSVGQGKVMTRQCSRNMGKRWVPGQRGQTMSIHS